MSLPPTDRDLLSRAAAGERPAFEALVGRHQGLVRAACLRQAPAAEADDCVQAVFLVLMRKPAQAAGACALEAWLLTVARHVCARARRAHENRRRAEQEAAVISTTGTATSDTAVSEHLDVCLEGLPERQRAVIAMHYLAGRSRDEIAGALGIGVDAVHQHCHRGLERLRELLRRRGVAVPAAGLLAVLATEAKGAGAVAPVAVLPAVAGGAAAIYAAGAVSAMTAAVLVPAGLAAAALVAVVGTGFALAGTGAPPRLPVSAPPATASTAAAPVTVPMAQVASDDRGRKIGALRRGPGVAGNAAAPGAKEPAWMLALRDQLRQEVTMQVEGSKALDVVEYLRRITSANIVVDPRLALLASAKLVTIKLDHQTFATCLDEFCEQIDAHWDLRDQAIYISGGAAASPAAGG